MKAIVLSRRDIREFDQIISFYTEEYGKREALAKGIKKIISKNAAAVEPPSLVTVEMIPGKDIDLMLTAVPITLFPEIRRDRKKITMVQYGVSFVDTMTDVGVPDKQLFYLLSEWLEFLAHTDKVHPVLMDAFVLRMLSLLGTQPELHRCVSCGDEDVEKAEQFSLSAGGIICLTCARERRQDQLLVPCDSEVRELLLLLLFGTYEGCVANSEDTRYRDTHRITYKFLQFHTDRRVADWMSLPSWLV